MTPEQRPQTDFCDDFVCYLLSLLSLLSLSLLSLSKHFLRKSVSKHFLRKSVSKWKTITFYVKKFLKQFICITFSKNCSENAPILRFTNGQGWGPRTNSYEQSKNPSSASTVWGKITHIRRKVPKKTIWNILSIKLATS